MEQLRLVEVGKALDAICFVCEREADGPVSSTACIIGKWIPHHPRLKFFREGFLTLTPFVGHQIGTLRGQAIFFRERIFRRFEAFRTTVASLNLSQNSNASFKSAKNHTESLLSRSVTALYI